MKIRSKKRSGCAQGTSLRFLRCKDTKINFGHRYIRKREYTPGHMYETTYSCRESILHPTSTSIVWLAAGQVHTPRCLTLDPTVYSNMRMSSMPACGKTTLIDFPMWMQSVKCCCFRVCEWC